MVKAGYRGYSAIFFGVQFQFQIYLSSVKLVARGTALGSWVDDSQLEMAQISSVNLEIYSLSDLFLYSNWFKDDKDDYS